MSKKHVAVFLIVFVSFSAVLLGLSTQSAGAQDMLVSVRDAILEALTRVSLFFARLCMAMAIFFLRFFIQLGAYNGFLDAPIVRLGWVMLRDIANMFFVVALLVIAFATILGRESYEWKKAMVKLVLVAIVVNFSLVICGLVLDAAHVFTVTFINAVAPVAAGNLIVMFNFDQMQSIITDSGGGQGGDLKLALFGGAVVAFFFSALAALTIGAYCVMLLFRMVAIWALLIFSPLAFVLSVLPATENYFEEWKSEFTKNVLSAPIAVFFLWLAFATMGANSAVEHLNSYSSGHEIGDVAADATGAGNSVSGIANDTNTNSVSINAASTWSAMAGFLVAMAFLLKGIEQVQSLGVAGSGWLDSAQNFAKSVVTIGSGYALGRWLVGGAANVGLNTAKNVGLSVGTKTGVLQWMKRGRLSTIMSKGAFSAEAARAEGRLSLVEDYKSKKEAGYTAEGRKGDGQWFGVQKNALNRLAKVSKDTELTESEVHGQEAEAETAYKQRRLNEAQAQLTSRADALSKEHGEHWKHEAEATVGKAEQEKVTIELIGKQLDGALKKNADGVIDFDANADISDELRGLLFRDKKYIGVTGGANGNVGKVQQLLQDSDKVKAGTPLGKVAAKLPEITNSAQNSAADAVGMAVRSRAQREAMHVLHKEGSSDSLRYLYAIQHHEELAKKEEALEQTESNMKNEAIVRLRGEGDQLFYAAQIDQLAKQFGDKLTGDRKDQFDKLMKQLNGDKKKSMKERMKEMFQKDHGDGHGHAHPLGGMRKHEMISEGDIEKLKGLIAAEDTDKRKNGGQGIGYGYEDRRRIDEIAARGSAVYSAALAKTRAEESSGDAKHAIEGLYGAINLEYLMTERKEQERRAADANRKLLELKMRGVSEEEIEQRKKDLKQEADNFSAALEKLKDELRAESFFSGLSDEIKRGFDLVQNKDHFDQWLRGSGVVADLQEQVQEKYTDRIDSAGKALATKRKEVDLSTTDKVRESIAQSRITDQDRALAYRAGNVLEGLTKLSGEFYAKEQERRVKKFDSELKRLTTRMSDWVRGLEGKLMGEERAFEMAKAEEYRKEFSDYAYEELSAEIQQNYQKIKRLKRKTDRDEAEDDQLNNAYQRQMQALMTLTSKFGGSIVGELRTAKAASADESVMHNSAENLHNSVLALATGSTFDELRENTTTLEREMKDLDKGLKEKRDMMYRGLMTSFNLGAQAKGNGHLYGQIAMGTDQYGQQRLSFTNTFQNGVGSGSLLGTGVAHEIGQSVREGLANANLNWTLKMQDVKDIRALIGLGADGNGMGAIDEVAKRLLKQSVKMRAEAFDDKDYRIGWGGGYVNGVFQDGRFRWTSEGGMQSMKDDLEALSAYIRDTSTTKAGAQEAHKRLRAQLLANGVSTVNGEDINKAKIEDITNWLKNQFENGVIVTGKGDNKREKRNTQRLEIDLVFKGDRNDSVSRDGVDPEPAS